MHVINIHAAYMSSVNSRYHEITLQSLQLYFTLTECTKRSQDCDPTLQQACRSKLYLGTDKFNKRLREALFKHKPSTRDRNSVSDYTSLISRRAPGRIHLRVQWFQLKT